MIDAKQAINLALEYTKQFFPAYDAFELEEIDMTEDEKYWLITIGMQRPNPDVHQLAAILAAKQKKYKVVQVNVQTGAVRKVYIRNI